MHVILAISGGVDSTAAALLLLREGSTPRNQVVGRTPSGYRVSGVFMSNQWQSGREAEEAAAVADKLGIAFHIVDYRAAFEKLVDVFADGYFAGRTPNPCALCNRDIKFGLLFDTMRQLGGDFLATGHYVRRMSSEQWAVGSGQYSAANSTLTTDDCPLTTAQLLITDHSFPAICCGRDAAKDQSYLMFGVAREKLARLLFPVGDYEKTAIRKLVAEAGFDFSQKRESQDICFVPDGEHVRFIHERRNVTGSVAGRSTDGTDVAGSVAGRSTDGTDVTGSVAGRSTDSTDVTGSVAGRSTDGTGGAGQQTSGRLVSVDGRVLGTHDGFEQFTIGQRKGMRVGFGERRYVVQIDANTCDVVIGTRGDLARRELTASPCHWLISPPQEPFRCQVKIRYRSPATWATVTPIDRSVSRIGVVFDEPRHAIAPGQVAACYLGDRIIGGGWIEA